MLLRLDRRLIALATAVLFALSVVGHGVMMVEIAGKAAAATAAMSVHNPVSDCEECPGVGDDAGMQTACVIHCASLVGIVSDPIQVSVTIAVQESSSPAPQPLSGRNRPPDPYPPKRSVLI